MGVGGFEPKFSSWEEFGNATEAQSSWQLLSSVFQPLSVDNHLIMLYAVLYVGLTLMSRFSNFGIV